MPMETLEEKKPHVIYSDELPSKESDGSATAPTTSVLPEEPTQSSTQEKKDTTSPLSTQQIKSNLTI